jgi:hypothetical protein
MKKGAGAGVFTKAQAPPIGGIKPPPPRILTASFFLKANRRFQPTPSEQNPGALSNKPFRPSNASVLDASGAPAGRLRRFNPPKTEALRFPSAFIGNSRTVLVFFEFKSKNRSFFVSTNLYIVSRTK